jgi:hypothetical protein
MGVKLQQYQSRVPLQLRQGLVAEVRASLKPGMEFNVLYGQVLSRLESIVDPSLERARALLRNLGCRRLARTRDSWFVGGLGS